MTLFPRVEARCYSGRRELLCPSLPGCDVAAEVESGADGGAEGPAAVGEDVVEGVVVDGVHLHAHADVLGECDFAATADAVEAGPIELVASGSELGDDDFLKRVGRVGRGALAQGAEGGPEEESQPGVVAVDDLRAEGKGLGEGVGGDGEVVARGQESEGDVLLLRAVDLGLERGGEKIGGEEL